MFDCCRCCFLCDGVTCASISTDENSNSINEVVMIENFSVPTANICLIKA